MIDRDRLSRRYRRFAEVEAAGRSPVYERLALFVAESAEILGFLAELPEPRQQPNLFLAAIRSVTGIPESNEACLQAVREHREEIRRIMLSRTTQTNEPARCALLLPILTRLPQPLALLEIGAAAGLCLLPDRYGYDYGRGRLLPAEADSTTVPVFPCTLNEAAPHPDALPSVVWRLGVDLNPLHPGSAEDAAWLETLVWPGMEDRAERLRQAIAVARRSPPRLVEADLLALDVEAIASAAPAHATLVVFHTAVLGYVADASERRRFAERMLKIGGVWISNEAPGVMPSPTPPALPRPTRDSFLLQVNGRPRAWCGPHGQHLQWLPD